MISDRQALALGFRRGLDGRFYANWRLFDPVLYIALFMEGRDGRDV